MTCTWSGSTPCLPRDEQVNTVSPDAMPWQSVRLEVDKHDGHEFRTHLFVQQDRWREGRLDPLLRLVADDATAGVTIAEPDPTWLYHPYGGGMDVIAGSRVQRDELRIRHSSWPSPPHGLLTAATADNGSLSPR